MLNTLRYSDEILPHEKFAPKAASGKAVSAKEMTLALRLIDEMSEQWDPARFSDTYREDILKRVKEKVSKGQTHELTAPPKRARAPAATELADLSALLQQSLAGTASSSASRGQRGRHATRRARRATGARRRA
jgi:DNA end-binding protein Ku